jgi:hypothetical protein
MALANLRDDDPAALMQFAKRFVDMLTDVPSAEEWWQMSEDRAVRALRVLKHTSSTAPWEQMSGGSKRVSGHRIQLFGPLEEMQEFERISDLSSHLRSIWSAPTLQAKKFRTLLLHEIVSSAGSPEFLVHPEVVEDFLPPGPFSQAILHLIESANRALVCENPECPAPLFFRSHTKKRQRYCSPKCSGFGQREAKRRWWAAKGEDWRKHHRQDRQRRRFRKNGRKTNGSRKTR